MPRSETSGTNQGKQDDIFRSNQANREEWPLLFLSLSSIPHMSEIKRKRGYICPLISSWWNLLQIYCKKHKIMFKPVCQNGAALRSERSNNQIGPLPEVVPNFAVSPNRNGLFHMTFYQKHRNFWHNGKHRWFFNRTRLTPFIVFVVFFCMVRESRTRVSSSPASNQISFHLREYVHPLRLEKSHITPAQLLLAWSWKRTCAKVDLM